MYKSIHLSFCTSIEGSSVDEEDPDLQVEELQEGLTPSLFRVAPDLEEEKVFDGGPDVSVK